MIYKIRKYLIENIAYVAVFSFAGIYLLMNEGANYTLNYISILLGLFIPAFVVINLYSIFKSLMLNEKLDYKELIVFLLLTILTIIIYVFGLKDSQRTVLGVINAVIGIIIIVIMLSTTSKKRNNNI